MRGQRLLPPSPPRFDCGALGALRDRAGRGPELHAWLGAGGQVHDLGGAGPRRGLQDWLRKRPVTLPLEDGTLAQHCDSEVNGQVARMLAEEDVRPLIDRMTSRGVFRRQTIRAAGYSSLQRPRPGGRNRCHDVSGAGWCHS